MRGDDRMQCLECPTPVGMFLLSKSLAANFSDLPYTRRDGLRTPAGMKWGFSLPHEMFRDRRAICRKHCYFPSSPQAGE